MTGLLSTFWTVLIFASIAWYAFLLIYIGYKAARELWAMTRRLSGRDQPSDQ